MKFVYENIAQSEPIKMILQRFFSDNDDNTINMSQSINNVFQIPVRKDYVDAVLGDNESSILGLVRSIIDTNALAIPGIQLSVITKNNTITIFVANVKLDGAIFELKQGATNLDINVPDIKDKALFIDFGDKIH